MRKTAGKLKSALRRYWKRLIYIGCFFMFCVIDQRTKTCSGLDGLREMFRNLAGTAVAVLTLVRFRRQDFRSHPRPYRIWGLLWLAGAAAALVWGIGNRPFLNEWAVTVCNVGLYGVILIRTGLALWGERRAGERLRAVLARKPGAGTLFRQKPSSVELRRILWLFMVLWMVFSRSDSLWPFCYLLMFGCFYLTDNTREDREQFIHGMCEGILLAFFAFWAFCLVFRPYDIARYCGVYNNPNGNSLFYVMALAAALCKLYFVIRKGYARWIRLSCYLLTGLVLAFLLLALGRAGWLAALVMVPATLALLNQALEERKFWKRGAALLLSVCLVFPVCFLTIRYVPPFFHHPVWFWGEWGEWRVHSWDPWDSEKFIDWKEYLDTLGGRIIVSIDSLFRRSPFLMETWAGSWNDGKPTDVLLPSDIKIDDYLVRKTIYAEYLKRLNWGGQKQSGFWLTESFYVYHAHDLYLQFGTDFGIPVLLLLPVLCFWSVAACIKRLVQKDGEWLQDFMCLCVVAGISVFGIFEYCWGSASLSMMLLFLNWRTVLTEPESIAEKDPGKLCAGSGTGELCVGSDTGTPRAGRER
ncbi:MAG: hypothetical protein LBQ15_03250 [Clostridium sp.]|jgi:hypothetical protein|nr:hypothetical protein [Clostridium sp.]